MTPTPTPPQVLKALARYLEAEQQVRSIPLFQETAPQAEVEKARQAAVPIWQAQVAAQLALQALDPAHLRALAAQFTEQQEELDIDLVDFQHGGFVIRGVPARVSDDGEVGYSVKVAITLQAAIKALQEQQQELERLRAQVAEQRWIPVSERLPEDGQEVLICWGGSRIATTVYYQTGQSSHRWLGVHFQNAVTHWQPLPTPPAATAQAEQESHGSH